MGFNDYQDMANATTDKQQGFHDSQEAAAFIRLAAGYPSGLTPEIEAKACAQRDAGNEEGRNVLCFSIAKFIVSRAYKFRMRGGDMHDMLQIGFMAAWNAAGKFDPSKGRFTTFAAMYIDGDLVDNLQKNGRSGYVPMNAQKEAHIVAKAAKAIEGSTGQEATMAQLAEATGKTIARVEDLLETLAFSEVSDLQEDGVSYIEARIFSGDDSPEDQAIENLGAEQLRQVAAEVLTDTERAVLEQTARGRTCRQIAEDLGMSFRNVGYVEDRAHKKLREALT